MMYFDGKIPQTKHLCSMDPKSLYYYSNGSGRDAFILINSGGFTVSRKPQVIFESGTLTRKISPR